MSDIKITFNPQGFAECLQGMGGMVQAEAEKIVARIGGPGKYTIEVVNEPRFHDAAYGVTRPVAVGRIIADSVGSKDEAENKSMSKAV